MINEIAMLITRRTLKCLYGPGQLEAIPHQTDQKQNPRSELPPNLEKANLNLVNKSCILVDWFGQ